MIKQNSFLIIVLVNFYCFISYSQTFQEFFALNSLQGNLNAQYYLKDPVYPNTIYINLEKQNLTDLDGFSEITIDGNLIQSYYAIVLTLSGNKFTEFPEEITKLQNITSLYLNNNKITSIPETIGNLSKVRDIDFSNNLIKDLPESFSNLIDLQNLNLRNNQLTQFPKSIPQNTPDKRNLLKEVDLSNNFIESIPEDIALYTQKLEKLKLNNNNIKYFRQWVNIKDVDIDLSVNPLKALSSLLYHNNTLNLQDTYIGYSILLDINTELKEQPSMYNWWNLFKKSKSADSLNRLKLNRLKLNRLKLIFFNDFSDKSNPKSIMSFKKRLEPSLHRKTLGNNDTVTVKNTISLEQGIIKTIYSYT